jgi:hypothetical protein
VRRIQSRERAFASCAASSFPAGVNIVGKAGTEELLRSDLPVVEYFDVHRVLYTPHVSKKGNRHD